MEIRTISTPAFDDYVDHLMRYGDLYAIKRIWEIIYLVHDEVERTEYFDELIDTWNVITVRGSAKHSEKARKELMQLLRLASTVDTEEICLHVNEARKKVLSALSKDQIHIIIERYNKKPEHLMIKPSSDEDDWTVTMRKFILDEKYLDYYMEAVIDLHLLSDFDVLTTRVIKLHNLNQRKQNLFPPEHEDYHLAIKNEDKLEVVLSQLANDGFIRVEDGELYWKGIGDNTIGSLAVLALYLEKTNIMRSFGTLVEGQRAYSRKFNVSKSDKKEWNKRYNEKNGVQLNSYGEFGEQLSFILDHA